VNDDYDIKTSPVDIETFEEKTSPVITTVREDALSIVVMLPGKPPASYTLPPLGRVTLGRDQKNDIRIDDDSVSRHHAVLHMGPPLRVEDVGSSNGSRIGKETLGPNERVELELGQPVEIGMTTIVIHQAKNDTTEKLASHSRFLDHLERACRRPGDSTDEFAVIVIEAEDTNPTNSLVDVITAHLHPSDQLATDSEHFEIFLDRCDVSKASQFIRRIKQETGNPLDVGIAAFPSEARDADGLLRMALRRISQAAPAAKETQHSPKMQQLYDTIDRIAPGTLSVLFLGETGSGKEYFAELLHRFSPRAHKPLVRLNCAALSETLLESELFGHAQGAFTNATQSKPGLLETAAGGTVFLDEIGELPLSTQMKLLRVIETHQVLPVGGLEMVPIDVRFVAATNRDLEREIGKGTFREDLYFRLAGASLVVPPLRQRTDEIERLVHKFVRRSARAAERTDPEITREAMKALLDYPWPGNVRELRNVVERAVLLCGDHAIQAQHLGLRRSTPQNILGTRRDSITDDHAEAIKRATEAAAARGLPLPTVKRSSNLRSEIDDLEKQRILAALEECGGNQSKAAKALGIARGTLLKRLDAYGIKRPRKR